MPVFIYERAKPHILIRLLDFNKIQIKEIRVIYFDQVFIRFA